MSPLGPCCGHSVRTLGCFLRPVASAFQECYSSPGETNKVYHSYLTLFNKEGERLTGNDLKIWRELIHMTQADLARLLNCSRSYISAIEAERFPLTEELRLRIRDSVTGCPLKHGRGSVKC